MDYTLPSFDQIDIKVDVRVLVSIPQHTSSSNFNRDDSRVSSNVH